MGCLGIYSEVEKLVLEEVCTKRKKPQFKQSEMHGDLPSNFPKV